MARLARVGEAGREGQAGGAWGDGEAVDVVVGGGARPGVLAAGGVGEAEAFLLRLGWGRGRERVVRGGEVKGGSRRVQVRGGDIGQPVVGVGDAGEASQVVWAGERLWVKIS